MAEIRLKKMEGDGSYCLGLWPFYDYIGRKEKSIRETPKWRIIDEKEGR